MDRLSPSSGVKKPRVYYGYIIAIASFLLLMISWGANFSFGVFFKPLLDEFGWSRAVGSGTYSLYLIVYGVSCFFAGKLSDRYGARIVVTACGISLGLSFLIMSTVDSLWQVYLGYSVLLGIGVSLCIPLLSAVARWFVQKRGLITGFVMAGVGTGVTIMPPIANQLIMNYGWRKSYLIIGIAALVLTVSMAQLVRRAPGQEGLAVGAGEAGTDSQNLQVQGFSLREAIRTRQFYLIAMIFFFNFFCIFMIMVHIVPHATDIGISSSSAVIIMSIYGIISIGSMIAFGPIGDKVGNSKAAIIISITMFVSFFWLIFSNELWMLFLFAVLFGIGYGGYSTIQPLIIAEYFGMKAHGVLFGLATFIACVGGAVGTAIAGRIFDINGSYYWAFIIAGILGVASMISAMLLRFSPKFSEREKLAPEAEL